MKNIKKIVSWILVIAMILTTAFYGEFGANAATNEDGTTDTEVVIKSQSGWSARGVIFCLSESDYAATTYKNKTPGTRISEYNLLEKISVTLNGTTYKLADVDEEWCYVPYGSAYDGSIAFKIPNSYGAIPTGTIITIPTGTVFPSAAYVGSTDVESTSTTVGGYVTTEEYKYIYNNSGSSDEYEWQKMSTKTETEVVIKSQSNWSARGVIFCLSESDYAATTYKNKTPGTRISEYNFLEKISVTLNGTTYKLADVDEEWCYVPYGSAYDGSIAFKIPNSYGAIPTGTIITIPTGTVFPSAAYVGSTDVESTSTTVGGYVTTEEYKYIYNNSGSSDEYEWQKMSTKTETEVTIESSNWSGRGVIFRLSESDYTATYKNGIPGAGISEYNFLENIVVTINGIEYKLSDVDESWNWVPMTSSNVNCIAFKLPSSYGAIPTGTLVTIPVGTVFPSAAYVGSSGGDNGTIASTTAILGGYVTSEEYQYIYEGNYTWSVKSETTEVDPTDISVTQLQSGVNSSLNAITFTLSNSDYANCSNYQMGDSYTDYNFLSAVKVYVEDTEYSLDDLDKDGGAKYYNLFGNANTVTIEFADADIYNSITKIVIPESVVFPALVHTGAAYFGGTDDTHPAIESTQESAGGFITTESVTFYRPLDATGTFTWQTTEPVEPTEISIVSFRTGHNSNIVSFTLSDSDYYSDGSALGTTALSDLHIDYNYLDTILVYTSDSEYVTLNNAYKSTGALYYNMWGVSNTVSVELNADVFSSAVRIVIPSGTVFPSYAYTSGATTEKGGYVTTADVTLVKPETTNSTYNGTACYAWETYVEVEEQTTKVTDVQLRDSRLFFFLTEQDYSCEKNTSITATNLAKYNTLENIIVLLNGVEKTLSEVYGSQAYYNLYGETGSVAFQAGETTSTYTTEHITQVLVKAGCEFPSYTFTNNGGTVMTTYVVEEDMLFTTDSSDTSGTHWTKTETRTIETTVTGIVLQNSAITFKLSDSDYPGTDLPNVIADDKHKEYSYWSQVRVYTDDTTYQLLSDVFSGVVYYTMWQQENTISVQVDSDTFSSAVRIVIPETSVFPAYDYTGGTKSDTTYAPTQMEMSGYESKYEIVFEKNAEGNWIDVSCSPSSLSADADGTNVVDSRDIVRAKWYIKNGYGHNLTSDCDDDYDTDEDDVQLIREVLVGKVLHNYKKESNSLTYFGSSDLDLDAFLNDYFKRHVGYTDYVEGDMSVNSYKVGTYLDGIFNLGWNTEALTWFDSSDTLESDRLAGQKEILESIIVDNYGYVWERNDNLEDVTSCLESGAKRTMGKTFPNALHTDSNVRYWEFNGEGIQDGTDSSTWESNIEAAVADGVYKGTANGVSEVEFEVYDYTFLNLSTGKDPIIESTEYAPWLAVDLRMSTEDYENIDDIYISFTTEYGGTYTEVAASEIAALTYDFAATYEHVIWLPMYQNSAWIGSDGQGAKIYQLKIEIRAKAGTTLSGDFALNYVRPSFDTRCASSNGIYISAMKQYYDYTGDIAFLEENIDNIRSAMEFYQGMYDSETNLIIDSKVLYGHDGVKDSIAHGVYTGYWDTLYAPECNLESNMYFYQALVDLAEIETILGEAEHAETYQKHAEVVLTAMRKDVTDGGFWNPTTLRFAAGLDDSGAVVDYGYTTWNLQMVESGIATVAQASYIMSWINGGRVIEGDTESILYQYSFAIRSSTVEDEGIFSYLTQSVLQDNVYNKAYGEDVQFGGAVMYTSYYELMSRIAVRGADDAFSRLQDIQSWYQNVQTKYENSEMSAADFYLSYYESAGIVMQNGTRTTETDYSSSNGAVGIDGEFTESLLTVAAIPYGFFGIDSESGDTLCVAPELPTELDRWKIENLAFCGVKYDVSIYADAVRIDSVRGNSDNLTIKVSLDYESGQNVYVDNAKVTDYEVIDGKAIVEVPFTDTIVEVR